MSKSILIILIIILIAVLGWTIYNLIRTENSRPELKDEISVEAQALNAIKPVDELKKFRKIVYRRTIAPAYDAASQKIKFFEGSSGKVFSIYPDGTREELISATEIPGILEAIWSPDFQKAILKTKDGNFYYNFSEGQAFVIDFSLPIWLDNNTVAYVCGEGICQSAPDGGNKKVLLKENLKDINLAFLDDKLYFYSKPGAETSPVFSLNPLKKADFNSDYFYKRLKCSKNYCAIPAGNFNLNDYLMNLVDTRDDIYQDSELIKKTNLDVKKIIELESALLLQKKTSGSLYILEIN